MRFINNLGETAPTKLTAWTTSTDQTLHWADPKGEGMTMPMTNYVGPIPAVPHLHGGEVPPELDGGPDAWFLSAPRRLHEHGHAYYSIDGSREPKTTASTGTPTHSSRRPSGSTTTCWAPPA